MNPLTHKTNRSFPLFIFLSLFFFTAFVQVPVSAGWFWMEDRGYTVTSPEQAIVVQRFQRAQNLVYKQEYSRAVYLLNRVRVETDSMQLFHMASLLRAQALYHQGEYIASYQAFKQFDERHDGERYRNLIVRYQIDIGFQLMKGKDHRTFLGLPILSAAWGGENIVRKLMSRYPYKPFSATYQYRLANLYFNRGSYEVAAEEYTFLLEQYEQSLWLSNAQFLAGESFFRTVEDVTYDVSNLEKARDHYRTYVQRYPDAPKVEMAKRRLREIVELKAKKAFNTADWYERTGRESGAVTYYQHLIERYPGTKWARNALNRLENLKSDVGKKRKKRVRETKRPRILNRRSDT